MGTSPGSRVLKKTKLPRLWSRLGQKAKRQSDYNYILAKRVLHRCRGERKQCHVTGSLDGLGDHALLACVEAGAFTSLDLAVGGQDAAKHIAIAVINVCNSIAGGYNGFWTWAAVLVVFTHNLIPSVLG